MSDEELRYKVETVQSLMAQASDTGKPVVSTQTHVETVKIEVVKFMLIFAIGTLALPLIVLAVIFGAAMLA